MAKKAEPKIAPLVAEIPDEFLTCREELRHSFRTFDAYVYKDGYERHRRCAICGTEVIRYYDRFGFQRKAPRYSYPQGYKWTADGGITSEDRASMHLRVLLGEAAQTAKRTEGQS